MRYRFSLGRGEALMVLGGAVAIGLLLFGAGVMTGLALAPSRAAAPAGAVMADAPTSAQVDSATLARALADSAAAMEGAPMDEEPAEPAAADPSDGTGGSGPGPDEAMSMGADGWSLPAGYTAPGRSAALPPIDGTGGPGDEAAEDDALSGAYASAGESPEAMPRGRPAGGTRFQAYDGGGAPYALQVGRFRDEREAVDAMEELRARGHDAYIYTVIDRGAPLYSVRMERYGDRRSATRGAALLERRERLTALVVPTEQR